MGKRLYKTYRDLSNIIVRVSNGTEEGKEHAVLVNSHLDSTLPSPGAADDALSVGVMIDCIRVLVNTPQWEPQHAIIFCAFRTFCISLSASSPLTNVQCSIMRRSRYKMGRICTLPNTRQQRRKQCSKEELIYVGFITI